MTPSHFPNKFVNDTMIVASHLVFLTVKWAYNRLTERFTGKFSHILKLFMTILMFWTPFLFLFFRIIVKWNYSGPAPPSTQHQPPSPPPPPAPAPRFIINPHDAGSSVDPPNVHPQPRARRPCLRGG